MLQISHVTMSGVIDTERGVRRLFSDDSSSTRREGSTHNLEVGLWLLWLPAGLVAAGVAGVF